MFHNFKSGGKVMMLSLRYLSVPLTAAILFLAQGAEAQQFRWVDLELQGDWGDHDFSCSQGVVPHPSVCNAGTARYVAVCWPNRPGCGSGSGIAWCTYKT